MPPFPLAVLHVWNAYHRIRRRCGSNGFGANPITWPDIDAYVRHSKLPLAPWEVRLIEEIDDLYMYMAAQNKTEDKPASD